MDPMGMGEGRGGGKQKNNQNQGMSAEQLGGGGYGQQNGPHVPVVLSKKKPASRADVDRRPSNKSKVRCVFCTRVRVLYCQMAREEGRRGGCHNLPSSLLSLTLSFPHSIHQHPPSPLHPHLHPPLHPHITPPLPTAPTLTSTPLVTPHRYLVCHSSQASYAAVQKQPI